MFTYVFMQHEGKRIRSIRGAMFKATLVRLCWNPSTATEPLIGPSSRLHNTVLCTTLTSDPYLLMKDGIHRKKIANSFAYAAAKYRFHNTDEYKWKMFDILGWFETIIVSQWYQYMVHPTTLYWIYWLDLSSYDCTWWWHCTFVQYTLTKYRWEDIRFITHSIFTLQANKSCVLATVSDFIFIS